MLTERLLGSQWLRWQSVSLRRRCLCLSWILSARIDHTSLYITLSLVLPGCQELPRLPATWMFVFLHLVLFFHLHHWGILVWQWHLRGWWTEGKNWFKCQIASAFLAMNSHDFLLCPEMLQNTAFPCRGVEIVHRPSAYMLHILTCFSVHSYFLTTKNPQSDFLIANTDWSYLGPQPSSESAGQDPDLSQRMFCHTKLS